MDRTIKIVRNMLDTKIRDKPHAWTLEEICLKVNKMGIKTSIGQIRNIIENKIIYKDGTFVSGVSRGIKSVYYREFRYARLFK